MNHELGAAAPHQPVPWLELADIAEWRRRRRDIAELEVRVERVPVEVTRREAGGDERLELRGEGDSPGGRDVVQRLDAEAVARQEERAGAGVPDRAGEHATQPFHDLGPQLFVQVHDRFGVAMSADHVPARDQSRPQLAVVVDLAVEYDRVRAVFGGHRLPPAREVDDAEPAHPEADGTGDEAAFVVRPTMTNRAAHRPDQGGIDGALGVPVDDAYDAAHTTAGSSAGRGGAPVIASIAVNSRSACSRRL